MRRVERSWIVGSVLSLREVEVVVDHVVRAVGEHDPEGGQREVPEMEGRVTDREEPGDRGRGERHRLDAGPRYEQPAPDRIELGGIRGAAGAQDLCPPLGPPHGDGGRLGSHGGSVVGPAPGGVAPGASNSHAKGIFYP